MRRTRTKFGTPEHVPVNQKQKIWDRVGRDKRKPIDPRLVQRLARIGCTKGEMCEVLGCSRPTLESFAEDIKLGIAHRNLGLRHRQYQLALQGDRTMLIWLGKQDLGQRESVTTIFEDNRRPEELSDEELTTIIFGATPTTAQPSGGSGNGATEEEEGKGKPNRLHPLH